MAMTLFEARGARGTAAIASQLAPFISPVDLLSLTGDLGSGKTTFAQALLKGLGVEEEVTSPTYALIHQFPSAKGEIFHCDFYRVEGQAGHLLGFDDLIGSGMVVAEWLERIETMLPPDRLHIGFEGEGEARSLSFTPRGAWEAKLARFGALRRFLERAGWQDAFCTHMRGDASAKTFSRLVKANGESRVLMNWPDCPDGGAVRDSKTYCELVHLARNGAPFVAVGDYLASEAGLTVPRVHEADLEQGFLLVDDLGDEVFERVARRRGTDVEGLYRLAVDGLLRLRRAPERRALDWGEGRTHRLHDCSPQVLQDEANLLLQWYFKLAAGFEAGDSAYKSLQAVWSPHFEWLQGQSGQIVLRDYHSPNLIFTASGEGLERLGVIDFQDALFGHPAYDLVSLLQDARIDLPPRLEETLFSLYCEQAAADDPGFNLADFTRAYCILGAQRNSKILGIFARLHLRDGKNFYLPHIPRVRRALRRNLDHPALANVKAWYAQHIFAWEHDSFSDNLITENTGLPL
jgi:tRNA threonylcarbamoyl adenosine modification protein YjeE